jgi:hypothetical protein
LRFDKFFPVNANCSSSSPLRTAVINMSMTVGGSSNDGTVIAVLPFATATHLNHLVGSGKKNKNRPLIQNDFPPSKKWGFSRGAFSSLSARHLDGRLPGGAGGASGQGGAEPVGGGDFQTDG